AATYYNNGVLTGITFWIPSYATPIDTYLAAADIQWDDAATLDDKMEMIHVQKYYSMFWTDNEQWFEYRRTGHPVLPKGRGLTNNGIMPARLPYPVYVQSANPANYKAAVAAQGPDEIYTQVWWQKP
ncbi:MAG TPA: SusD/RagB family nutrient-binding outer membrane lipoprotein, partial [Pedobacter sp.]